ncbi:MAG: hypothetical protein PGN13_03985 [Patulibacter minatonensis]
MLPTLRSRALRGPALRGLAATALLVPVGAGLAIADGTTPAPRSLDGGATAARITWTAPAAITEDTKFTLGLRGEINGQATAHIALVDAPACPASPLYPRQLALGTRLAVTVDPAAVVVPTPTPTAVPATTPTPTATGTPDPLATPTPTPTATPTPAPTATPAPTPAATAPATTPLGGLVDQALSLTEKDSGDYRLCGWVVASPASSEASTVARFDQPVTVANRAATLSADVPETARSGDYFTVKVTGQTPGTGRRLLVMAEPDKGQQCSTLRKAAAGKRPLQTVVSVGSGNFSKTLKLRYRTKTSGPHLLCIQVVETSDRNPEGVASRVQTVTESLKCVNTQAAVAQRRKDLEVIRRRRDTAQDRISAARQKLAPLRQRYATAKKASDRRIATARRAVSRAKSAAGRKQARKRLASVRRTESRKLSRAGAPLRKANAAIKVQERTYKQYRTGANLLNDSIARMKKDTKKYCSKAAA